MCLVSLDESKICDCFSDCPGDVDEAHCHTQLSQDPIPPFPGAPIYEESFRYHKCCALLGEGQLKESNISPQAIKFCQTRNDETANKFKQAETPMFQATKTIFPDSGEARNPSAHFFFLLIIDFDRRYFKKKASLFNQKRFQDFVAGQNTQTQKNPSHNTQGQQPKYTRLK